MTVCSEPETLPVVNGEAPPPPPEPADMAGLPTVSATGRGEWNDALVVQIMQACASGLDPAEKDILGKRLRAASGRRCRGSSRVTCLRIWRPLNLSRRTMLRCKLLRARGELPDQPFAVWRESLNQANRLSRTFAEMLEALNRHRGKGGQQRVVVEHVTVNEGGQAVVGAVERPGGRGGDG